MTNRCLRCGSSLPASGICPRCHESVEGKRVESGESLGGMALRIAGRVLGAVLLGGLGGLILGITVGRSLGIVGVLVGLAVGYLLVRYWLMRFRVLRPTLRWLFPYESWTESGD